MPHTSLDFIPPAQGVEYLLFAIPRQSIETRLIEQVRSWNLVAEPGPLGVKVPTSDWHDLVRALHAVLSEPERRDIRVAVLTPGTDDVAFRKAIFNACTFERLFAQINDAWLYDVLREDRLEVHFHPLIQFPPGRVHGYECLIRGHDPGGRLIPPAQLFQAARHLHGLSGMDHAARLAAVKAIAAQRDEKSLFFINFMPSAVYDPEHCLTATLAAIDAAGLPHEQIVFEVVESDEVKDLRHLTRILSFYRDRGFKVALDDVGSGFSNLLTLCELRPDYIKLDGELLRRASHRSLEGKIVQDLCNTTRQHGIITIAEGVETVDHLRFAMECGIRLTQGFIHSKPRPTLLTEMESFVVYQRMKSLQVAMGH